MFTGIIEAMGRVEQIEKKGTNINFVLSSPFTSELKIDQSVAHNGCCLTVVDIAGDRYTVNAIDESLINLERCMQMGGRLDGHIVQGHIDRTGVVEGIENKDGSYFVSISYDESREYTTVPQGSITVNGVSLTVAQTGSHSFSVALIPYTWEHTNLHLLKIGDSVNLEFDIIGKYVAKLINK